MNAPPRGEVWLVDLGMVAKVRPAVVVSVPAGIADRALVTFVPHTTSVRTTTYEVPIRVPFLKAGAFDVQGLVSIPAAAFADWTSVNQALGLLLKLAKGSVPGRPNRQRTRPAQATKPRR